MKRSLSAAVFASTSAIMLAAVAGAGDGPPEEVGLWEGPYEWPVFAVHSCMLSTGKVLQWSYTGMAGLGSTWLFDPATWAFTEIPLDRDIFCGGNTQLADGRILVAGGDTFEGLRHDDGFFQGIPDTHIFDPVSETWTRVGDMRRGRWYPTAITMPDGRVLVFTGRDETGLARNRDVEIYDPWNDDQGDAGWEVVSKLDLPLYVRLSIMPDGNLFKSCPGIHSRVFNVDTWATSNLGQPQFAERWDSLSVPLGPDGTSILLIGGNDLEMVTNTCERIDLTDPEPNWAWTGSMVHARMHSNAVLLPDGDVLVVGGNSMLHDEGFTDSDGDDHSVYEAELYDTESGTWSTMATMTDPRNYHSTALLLQDGRVLVTAGDDSGSTTEFYSPPYLFKGQQPVINAAPPSLPWGQPFLVTCDDTDAVAGMSLVRLSTVTHSLNVDQRIVPLEVDNPENLPGALLAELPESASTAPPGYYMLFLLNTDGVPSVAEMVRIGTPVGDVNGDGIVGVDDILGVIQTWGACVGCGADVNATGTVGAADLLLLLDNWT